MAARHGSEGESAVLSNWPGLPKVSNRGGLVFGEPEDFSKPFCGVKIFYRLVVKAFDYQTFFTQAFGLRGERPQRVCVDPFDLFEAKQQLSKIRDSDLSENFDHIFRVFNPAPEIRPDIHDQYLSNCPRIEFDRHCVRPPANKFSRIKSKSQ
jgi:hypothetical protein